MPYLRAIVGTGLAVAATAAVAADVATADASSPASLLKSVCLADEARLSSRYFQAISFRELPEGVKAVIGFSLPNLVPGNTVPMAPIEQSDVPNPLFAVLSDKDIYLLLPAPTSEGRVARHCAIIWRGNHYDEALDALDQALVALDPGFAVEDTLALLPTPRGRPGLQSIAAQGGGRIAGAAEFNGWTMIRVAPEASAEEQVVQ